MVRGQVELHNQWKRIAGMLDGRVNTDVKNFINKRAKQEGRPQRAPRGALGLALRTCGWLVGSVCVLAGLVDAPMPSCWQPALVGRFVQGLKTHRCMCLSPHVDGVALPSYCKRKPQAVHALAAGPCPQNFTHPSPSQKAANGPLPKPYLDLGMNLADLVAQGPNAELEANFKQQLAAYKAPLPASNNRAKQRAAERRTRALEARPANALGAMTASAAAGGTAQGVAAGGAASAPLPVKILGIPGLATILGLPSNAQAVANNHQARRAVTVYEVA